MMVWTAEQTMRFLARAAKAKDLFAQFHLVTVTVTVTGLRRGEVAGLRWADVDPGDQVAGRTGVGALYGANEDSTYTRRINLDPRVEPNAGTGWELAAERDHVGAWHVLHDGDVVGVIERRSTITGANTCGWEAARGGMRVALGADSVGLCRSRDLAAAAIIHVEHTTPDNVRARRPA
ncbi:hypothetical protein LO772_22660 [Yinghuangia sp. ASG 101]|uniref:hypothetical protein n=1 Tax=Yinghuangia sp. ASG 101 TaxID=2896848 RepID=UPI001E48545B|nr:hypothetical protein [Yinghuangia sp. ASG 101]UGQ09704.1 hypothetical protein LO772_22660 [Yinghuangia sp. ASG 101]